MNIAFLGMGLMGSRMAKRLLDAGMNVAVWNRTPAACLPLQSYGATILTEVNQITTADVIALCLSDDDAVNAVAQQLIPALKTGQIIVDFSSVSAPLSQTLALQTSHYGAIWIDAPVSGGVQGAEQGTLVVFTGGDETTVQSLAPFFAPLAQRVNYMGASGAGQITKICNQLIVASNSTIIAEAVALASKAGIDPTLLAPALAGGFADSKPLQILAPRMATHTFLPVQWKVKTLHKDLSNALILADKHGVTLPVAHLAQTQLEQAISNGGADDDLSSIIRLFEQ